MHGGLETAGRSEELIYSRKWRQFRLNPEVWFMQTDRE